MPVTLEIKVFRNIFYSVHKLMQLFHTEPILITNPHSRKQDGQTLKLISTQRLEYLMYFFSSHDKLESQITEVTSTTFSFYLILIFLFCC